MGRTTAQPGKIHHPGTLPPWPRPDDQSVAVSEAETWIPLDHARPQPQSWLFRFPPEIRHLIYGHVFQTTANAPASSQNNDDDWSVDPMRLKYSISTSLLVTCRATYNETALLPFTISNHHVLYWGGGGLGNPVPTVLLEYLQHMTPWQVRCLRHISFHISHLMQLLATNSGAYYTNSMWMELALLRKRPPFYRAPLDYRYGVYRIPPKTSTARPQREYVHSLRPEDVTIYFWWSRIKRTPGTSSHGLEVSKRPLTEILNRTIGEEASVIERWEATLTGVKTLKFKIYDRIKHRTRMEAQVRDMETWKWRIGHGEILDFAFTREYMCPSTSNGSEECVVFEVEYKVKSIKGASLATSSKDFGAER